MTIIKKILENAEAIVAWLASHSLGADLPAYCQLETAIGFEAESESPTPYILITRQCAMLTLFELIGSINVVGQAEFEQITGDLHRVFAAYFQRAGHSIEISFERDPELIRSEVTRLMQPAYQTAARIGLNLQDVLDDRCERISALCSHECCYVLLYTHLSALTPDEFKREMAAHQQRIKAHRVEPMLDAQSVTAIIKGILHIHKTFVDTVEKDFLNANLQVKRRSTHDAARAIRLSYDRRRTDETWRPVLPGDIYTPHGMQGDTMPPLAGLYMPKLSAQMCSGQIQTAGEYVYINGEYHGSAYMEIGPQEIHDFTLLFNRIGFDIPWRIKFDIEPGGLAANKFRRLAVSVIGFMSETNKAIKRSFDAIEKAQQAGECIVTVRITASTWGAEKKICQARLSTLVRALQGWGIPQICTDAGDPIAGLASTVPGFSNRSVAPKLVAPLADIIRLLPITRPASPWSGGGSMMLRTLDGKVYPFQPNSSLQTAWIDLIWAIMGSGKSVWLNTLNLGAILSPGLQRLPLITIIDVGSSSSGLIDLLQHALPEERRHEAIAIRLRNEAKFAINPFDTLPGCRKPTALDREFLISLLTALATPVSKKAPFPGAPELVGMLVDEVYEKYATCGSQKHYEPTIDGLVDTALTSIGFIVDEFTSWWDVTDELTKAGKYREARRAQRFAVPVLADLIEQLGSERIRSVFEPSETSRAMTDTGMTLLDAMRMVITTALRDFPIIAQHTQFELNDQARVIALDLEEVTRGTGQAGERRSEILYTFARQIAARQYYLPEDICEIAPVIYHAAHKARYEAVKDEIKALCIDELHRTGGKPSFRRLLALDRREGRKHGIRISLASQFMSDFETDGESITESAFSIYMMNAGTQQSRVAAQKLFALSDSAMLALQTEVRGAGKFLVWHQTKMGTVTQVLHNAPGAIELWAFSTTAQDIGLRRRLYQRMPPPLARKILANAFPKGTAAPYIEVRQAALGLQNKQNAQDNESILDAITYELIEKYSHHRRHNGDGDLPFTMR